MSWKIEYLPPTAQQNRLLLGFLKERWKAKGPPTGDRCPILHIPSAAGDIFFKSVRCPTVWGAPAFEPYGASDDDIPCLKSLQVDVPLLRRRLPTGPLMFCFAASFHRLQNPISERLTSCSMQIKAQAACFNNSLGFSIAGEL